MDDRSEIERACDYVDRILAQQRQRAQRQAMMDRAVEIELRRMARELGAESLQSWESFQDWTPEPSRICPVSLIARKCAPSRLDWEY